jgi:hypothetical protein
MRNVYIHISLYHNPNDCIPLYPKLWLALYAMLMLNPIFKQTHVGVSENI